MLTEQESSKTRKLIRTAMRSNNRGAAKAFYSLGESGWYADCVKFERQHLSRMVREFDSRSTAIDDLIGQNALFYAQMLLRRSHSLLRGAMECTASGNSLSAVLSVRAHFEVTGAIGYLSSNLDKYYSKQMEKAALDELLSRLTLGRRMQDLKKPFEAINVLTMIDEADRVFNRLAGNKVGLLRDSYEWLSETCHPNAYGLIMNTRKKQERVVEFRLDRERTRINYHDLGYLRLSMPLFFEFYDYVVSKTMENERIPEMKRGLSSDDKHSIYSARVRSRKAT